MRRTKRPGRFAITATSISLASISLAAVGALATPARSAAPPAPSVVTSFSITGVLWGVAATSASNAWAVGYSGAQSPKTLIAHWNGTKWSQVTTPKPVNGELMAVTAVSAHSAWAVGYSGSDVLILHWNGTRWSVQGSGAPVAGVLNGVAVSGDSVWAVGVTDDFSVPLILHGVGNRWHVVPSAAPGNAELSGVAATSGGRAWADGFRFTAQGDMAGLLLRWNGKVWKPVASPLQGVGNFLGDVAAGPAGRMWAVGSYSAGSATVSTPASMLWDGKTWRKEPVGAVPRSSGFGGVTFVPRGTAWAVGTADVPSTCCGGSALIMRWTGRAWIQVANPDSAIYSALFTVAATAPANAWAVGFQDVNTLQLQTLILHWNGKTWS